MAKKVTLAKRGNKKKNSKKEDKSSSLRKGLASKNLLNDKCETVPQEFVSTGCVTLNLALTNDATKGYPVGRVINIVGDYSTGKTLVSCELVNSIWYNEHEIKGKRVKIIYDEPERAFDMNLAKNFNMPLTEIHGLNQRLKKKDKKENKGVDDKDFIHSKTIEQFADNIDKHVVGDSENYDVVLYVLDSLDSVSDGREQARIEKKGYGSQDYGGGGKPAVLSEFFRNKVQDLDDKHCILFIISQIRDNIGVMFGKKHKRSGGKALDFYCTQIIWLLERGKVTSSKGIVQGIEVEVNVDKNKVGERYNNIKFNILHGYGIDNISSMIDFLWDNKGFEKAGAYIMWENGKKYYRTELGKIADEDETVYNRLVEMCQDVWNKLLEDSRIERNPKWGRKILQ